MKKGKEIGHVKRYPSQSSIFLFSHSTLAICNKSHHSRVVITEVLTEEILFHFWLLSAALILRYFPMDFMSFSFFFTLLFSSVVSVMKDWCQVINFASFGKKKSQSELMVYFIDKSIPPYSVQNLRSISAQCGRICQLLKCQSSIMEK